MRVNTDMRKPLLSVIGSAPLAAVLAVVSAAVTLVVAATTLAGGQVPGDAGLELIGALVLAAVAVSEASRPQRSDRGRRRQDTGQQDAQDTVAGH
jgi:hypothetical protein